MHTHPYPPFIPEGATKLIVGTLPPPRFTTGQLKPGDVDFCYGSRDGLLWPVLNRIFSLQLNFETTESAVEQRKHFLIREGIGICDIVESATRKKIDASDLGMEDVILRDMLGYLRKHQTISRILFTGGNSKNGPEYHFRRHLKEFDLSLGVVNDQMPKIHQFTLPGTQRIIETVSLVAPSGSANRAVGSNPEYKLRKEKNPEYNTIDFRVEQYDRFFKD